LIPAVIITLAIMNRPKDRIATLEKKKNRLFEQKIVFSAATTIKKICQALQEIS
jgi:hypothetical protein